MELLLQAPHPEAHGEAHSMLPAPLPRARKHAGRAWIEPGAWGRPSCRYRRTEQVAVEHYPTAVEAARAERVRAAVLRWDGRPAAAGEVVARPAVRPDHGASTRQRSLRGPLREASPLLPRWLHASAAAREVWTPGAEGCRAPIHPLATPSSKTGARGPQLSELKARADHRGSRRPAVRRRVSRRPAARRVIRTPAARAQVRRALAVHDLVSRKPEAAGRVDRAPGVGDRAEGKLAARDRWGWLETPAPRRATTSAAGSS